MKSMVMIWGGGDLATGVALRLFRVGMRILVVETQQPMAVRRSVAFAQTVYDGDVKVESVVGKLIEKPSKCADIWQQNFIPVMVDPNLNSLEILNPLVLVDARMKKQYNPFSLESAALIVGLGPGFIAGDNCHAAIETNRGHFLGRVYWAGSPNADTGIPGKVQNYDRERVLHSPCEGKIQAFVGIGDVVEKEQEILQVGNFIVRAPFHGLVRGLIRDGIQVKKGTKLGDIDPRIDPFRCYYVSEKSLAIGGGVLEAILTRKDIRSRIWKD